jgi:type I restriction enzyme S subunit
LQVIKPPLVLIEKFGNLIAPMFEQVLTLINKNFNLRKTRDLLLPKLISGEIDVEHLDISTEDIAA